MNDANHPNHTELTDFLYDELSPARKAEVAQHVAECESCRAVLSQWRDVRSELQAWKLRDIGTSRRVAGQTKFRRILQWAVAASLLVAAGFGLARLTGSSAVDVATLRGQIAQQVRDDLNQEFTAKWSQLAADEAVRRKELREALFKRIDQFERLRLAEYTGLREDVETVAIRTQEEFDRLASATFLRPQPDVPAGRPQPPSNE